MYTRSHRMGSADYIAAVSNGLVWVETEQMMARGTAACYHLRTI